MARTPGQKERKKKGVKREEPLLQHRNLHPRENSKLPMVGSNISSLGPFIPHQLLKSGPPWILIKPEGPPLARGSQRSDVSNQGQSDILSWTLVSVPLSNEHVVVTCAALPPSLAVGMIDDYIQGIMCVSVGTRRTWVAHLVGIETSWCSRLMLYSIVCILEMPVDPAHDTPNVVLSSRLSVHSETLEAGERVLERSTKRTRHPFSYYAV